MRGERRRYKGDLRREGHKNSVVFLCQKVQRVNRTPIHNFHATPQQPTSHAELRWTQRTGTQHTRRTRRQLCLKALKALQQPGQSLPLTLRTKGNTFRPAFSLWLQMAKSLRFTLSLGLFPLCINHIEGNSIQNCCHLLQSHT